MRTTGFFIGFVPLAMFLAVSSCDNSKDQSIYDIEGVYTGSFSKSASLTSTSAEIHDTDDGIAVVSVMDSSQVEVHCYGSEIDTTLMLYYFENHDSVMVCLTGADFEHTYGHSYGEGHMSGGMMGDMRTGETEWTHHMKDEHHDGDLHFGGFNRVDGTFSYAFHMMDQTTPFYMNFHGIKNK